MFDAFPRLHNPKSVGAELRFFYVFRLLLSMTKVEVRYLCHTSCCKNAPPHPPVPATSKSVFFLQYRGSSRIMYYTVLILIRYYTVLCIVIPCSRAVSNELDELEIWHRRLGHVSASSVIRTAAATVGMSNLSW